MLTPEDLSLAESLLRNGKIDPDALQKQISLMSTSGSQRRLADVLESAGLIHRGESAAFQQTMAPGGAPAGRTEGASAPRKLVGRYEIVRELARGGMGVVYEGWEPALRRRVAVKVLLAGEGASDDQIERFVREARAAAALQHPNIIQVYEVGEAPGGRYLAMEYVEGTSLDKVLKEERALPPRRALRIAMDAGRALQHAHERRIVHRDVKPGNILLAPAAADNSLMRSMDGSEKPERVLLGDFGLAKEMGAGSSLTMSGNLIGTPAYMSPEQAAGHVSKIDARSDVYSLGAVLYEMLSGKPPFAADTLADMLSDIRSLDAVPLRAVRQGLHRDIEVIVQKAMAKEPDRRYATAGEFADDIERYLAGEAVVAVPPTFGYRLGRWLRKHRAAVAAAIVAVVAVGGVGGTLGWRALRDRREAAQRRESEARARRDSALGHVAAALQLAGGGDFEGALVQTGLAEAALPGLPETAGAARDIRRRRYAAQCEDALTRENWAAAAAVLESASEFRDDPDIRRLARRAAGTCSIAASAAEPGVEVDLAVPEPGVFWTDDSFPPMAEARRAGLCAPLGPAPAAPRDVPFGDHLLVFSRDGRAVRVLPLRLTRSTDLRAEYRRIRVGRSRHAAFETPAAALPSALPGTVLDLEPGVHSLSGVPLPAGVTFRALPGGDVEIGHCEAPFALSASGAHGLEFDGITFANARKEGAFLKDCFRPAFRRCRFLQFGGTALQMKGCTDWLVSDVEIRQARKRGLQAESARGGLALRVACSDVPEAGLDLMGERLWVLRGVVERCGEAGIAVSGDDGRVEGCRVADCPGYGVQIYGGRRMTAEDNLVINCCTASAADDPAAVYILNAEVRFAHNTIHGGRGTGLGAKQCSGKYLANVIAGVQGRAFHYHGSAGADATSGTTSEFDWHVSWDCRIWGRFWEREYPRREDALADERIRGWGGCLVHSWDADPQFADAGKGDFRLQAASFARGAGPGGSDLGARLEALAADALPTADWLRRENGRTCVRAALTALEASDPARARRLAAVAEVLCPEDPALPPLRERLR